jgi:4-hydroxymandelate oxidase
MIDRPLLLKGILDGATAETAVNVGADGIPLLLDGGIRRGTDVVKALALGAAAVLIGRPYVYGLAVGGAEGVARVVRILRDELETAMALLGRASVPSLDRTILW